MPAVVRAERLVDAAGGVLAGGAVLVVDGETIAWVGAADALPSRYADATVVDHGDATILPGLVDCHTHFTLFADLRTYEQMAQESDAMMLAVALRNAGVHLRSGVTTARDNGSRNRIGYDVREALWRGYVPGPRLLVSGPPVTPTGGHFHFCNGVADGGDGVERRVRQLVEAGSDHVKVMASGGDTEGTDPGRACYSVAELRAIATTAHGLDRLTTAHCRATEAIDRAVEAGVDCIEHGEFVAPDGTMRFDERVADRLATSRTYLSPTLPANGWNTIIRLGAEAATRELTQPERRELAVAEREIEARLEQVGRLIELGMTERIVAGTDAGCYDFTFGHIAYSLELMVRAGMSQLQAILATTRHAAMACGVFDSVGSLEVGKRADAVVVRGDPLTDITTIGRVEAVYAGGAPVAGVGAP